MSKEELVIRRLDAYIDMQDSVPEQIGALLANSIFKVDPSERMPMPEWLTAFMKFIGGQKDRTSILKGFHQQMESRAAGGDAFMQMEVAALCTLLQFAIEREKRLPRARMAPDRNRRRRSGK